MVSPPGNSNFFIVFLTVSIIKLPSEVHTIRYSLLSTLWSSLLEYVKAPLFSTVVFISPGTLSIDSFKYPRVEFTPTTSLLVLSVNTAPSMSSFPLFFTVTSHSTVLVPSPLSVTLATLLSRLRLAIFSLKP